MYTLLKRNTIFLKSYLLDKRYFFYLFQILLMTYIFNVLLWNKDHVLVHFRKTFFIYFSNKVSGRWPRFCLLAACRLYKHFVHVVGPAADFLIPACSFGNNASEWDRSIIQSESVTVILGWRNPAAMGLVPAHNKYCLWRGMIPTYTIFFSVLI